MKEKLNSAVYGLKKSAIREFSRLAKETPGCVALTLGEPDFDTPSPIRLQAEYSLENHETHYIENSGLFLLRERIARFEKEKHGFVCNENGFTYIGLNPPNEIIESNLKMYLEMSKETREHFQKMLLSHDLRGGRKRVMRLINS